MRCETIEELLPLFVEGSVTASERERVERHLRDCEDCAGLVSHLRRVDCIVAGWQAVPADLGLRLASVDGGVRRRIDREQILRPSFRFEGRTLNLAASTALVLALAALLLVLASWPQLRTPFGGDQVQVTISALEPVNLTVEVDGVSAVDGNQPAGWSQTYKGREVRLWTDDGHAVQVSQGSAAPVRVGYRSTTYEVVFEAGRPERKATATPAPLDAPIASIAIYHNGTIDRLEANSSAFEPVAGTAGQVVQHVRRGISAALANPWDEADRVKATGLAVELVFSEPGVQIDSEYRTALIPLDTPTGRGDVPVFLGNDRYTRLASANADEQLTELRRVLGVREPSIEPSPAEPTEAPLTIEKPEATPSILPADLQFVMAFPYYWVIDGERVDRSPKLSPDGTKVAYLPTLNGEATDVDRIVVRDLATGEERDLTPEVGYSYTSVRWSPDGRSLAFVKHRFEPGQATQTEVWQIEADGNNLRLLYRPLPAVPDMPGPALAIRRWTHDGQHLQLHPTIWGGGVIARQVRTDGGGEDAQVLPEAQWFDAQDVDSLVGETVFAPAGEYALHVVKSDGLMHRPGDAPSGGHSLVLYDTKSGSTRVLASFPGVVYLSEGDVSPDGRWISFRAVVFPASGPPTEPAKLWVVQPDGTGLTQVEGQFGALESIEETHWAANGRAFFSTRATSGERQVSHLYELDAQSGRAWLLSVDWSDRALVDTSPDGQLLLAIRGAWLEAALEVIPFSSLQRLQAGVEAGSDQLPKTTPPPVAEANRTPRFGPPVDLLVPLDWGGGGMTPRISPDGQWVAYYRFPREADGKRIDAGKLIARSVRTGAEIAVLELTAEITDYAWTPDSQEVIVVEWPGEARGDGTDMRTGRITVKPISEKPSRTIMELPKDAQSFGEVAVSPDGSRLAIAVGYYRSPAPIAAVGILLVNMDGTGQRQVVEPGYFIGSVRWSPDGRDIVYFKGKGARRQTMGSRMPSTLRRWAKVRACCSPREECFHGRRTASRLSGPLSP